MDSIQDGSVALVDANGSAQRAHSESIRNEVVKSAGSGPLNGAMNGDGTAALARPGLPRTSAPESRVDPGHAALARATKRMIDLVGALLLIVILMPFMVVTAVLIKLDSPGPILFRQRRIGRGDEPIEMLKFRTMIDGADEQKAAIRHLNEAAEGLFKIDRDPRVTKVGRWLRATSLDELPQLLHVVTGRMSLVGPRPLVPEEDARITGSHRRRLRMRPGMTGVWQIGGASAIPIQQMVKLDAGYVDNWSLWVDVKVLAETAAYVVLRKSM